MRAVWCLFLVTLATVYAGNVKVEYVDIPNEYIPEIEKASTECVKKLNLEEEQITLQRFLKWELSDSANTHKYIFCLGNDSGYFADDGTIHKDKVLAIMGKYRDRADGVIDECNKLKYNNKYEEVYRKEVYNKVCENLPSNSIKKYRKIIKNVIKKLLEKQVCVPVKHSHIIELGSLSHFCFGWDFIYFCKLLNVPSEYAGDILEAAASCVDDSTGTAIDAVQKVISANLENTESFKKFLYCFATTSGYVDSNGHIVVDKMTKLIGNHKDKAKFIDALNLCNKSEAGNTIDIVYQLSVCFKDNSPIHFTV